MKDDSLYLRHILECITRIEEAASAGREAFHASHIVQDAILRNLQILSESTQRLSEALKANKPGIPWRRIAAFRNVLVHDYLAVEIETVWNIVQDDLPPLKTAVTEMLRAGNT